LKKRGEGRFYSKKAFVLKIPLNPPCLSMTGKRLPKGENKNEPTLVWVFFALRSALCGFGPPAGFHADTTDIMAEVEGFGKGSELFVTSKVIEVLLSFPNCPCRADRQAIVTGTAIIQ